MYFLNTRTTIFTAQKDEWLLLFDNADEPNIDLNKFFPPCKHGNIIITTRNPGLCVYAGANTHVDNMEEEDAAVLLLKTAALEDVPKNTVAATAIVKVCYSVIRTYYADRRRRNWHICLLQSFRPVHLLPGQGI